METETESIIKSLNKSIENAMKLDPLIKELKDLFLDKEVTVINDGDSPSLYFSVSNPTEEMPEYLRRLGRLDFRHGSADLVSLNWTLIHKERGKVWLFVSLKGDQCKKVRIGTREVGIYEIQCSSDEPVTA